MAKTTINQTQKLTNKANQGTSTKSKVTRLETSGILVEVSSPEYW
jgi:ribosomal protein S1